MVRNPNISQTRQSPRNRSNLMDASVSSSTDESDPINATRPNDTNVPNVSSQQISSEEIQSQNVVQQPSREDVRSEEVIPSQPHLSQESRDPNTQRILQEVRSKPGPKSVKRQREIAATQSTASADPMENFRKRLRLIEEQQAAKRLNQQTSRSTSNSTPNEDRRRSTNNESTEIQNQSSHGERSYDQRILTQNVDNISISPRQNMPPPRNPTDDANGHSNLAAPRRIQIVPPSPPPTNQPTFNPRQHVGKLPGG